MRAFPVSDFFFFGRFGFPIAHSIRSFLVKICPRVMGQVVQDHPSQAQAIQARTLRKSPKSGPTTSR